MKLTTSIIALTVLASSFAFADGICTAKGVCTINDNSIGTVSVLLDKSDVQDFSYAIDATTTVADPAALSAAVKAATSAAITLQSGGVCVYLGQAEN